jgi:hypothetical protein
MINRRFLVAASLVTPILMAAPAMAQGQAITGIGTITTYSVDGRVTAVDPGNRTVTLAYLNGSTGTYTVSPAVATFASTKVGDVVSASLEDKRTFVLSGPNTKVPGDTSTSAGAAVSSGGSTTGAAVNKTITNWWVTSVDPTAGKILLVDPGGGQIRTYSVTDSAARADLSRVKPGDNLTAINSSTAVISLTPKG